MNLHLTPADPGASADVAGALGGRELRLLMGPVVTVRANGRAQELAKSEFGRRYRWVTENGHTGGCSEQCWHQTPEAALDCFRRPRAGGRR